MILYPQIDTDNKKRKEDFSALFSNINTCNCTIVVEMNYVTLIPFFINPSIALSRSGFTASLKYFIYAGAMATTI